MRGRANDDSPPRPAKTIGILVLIATCGLGPSPARPETVLSLELVADRHIPTRTAFERIGDETPAIRSALPPAEPVSQQERIRRKASGEFGGVSALAFDPGSGTLHALSDSSSPTIFVLRLELDPPELRLRPEAVIRLRDERGEPLPEWSLDPARDSLSPPTGPTWSPRKATSKGIPRFNPRCCASIRTGEGRVPAHFLASGSARVGVRANQGFEGLSLSPSGETLFAATEGPLAQDADCGDVVCPARILLYAADDSGWRPFAELSYRYEPPEAPPDFGTAPRRMGLTEILALDDRRLLTLERGFSRASDGRTHLVARVFETELPSAPSAAPTTLRKRLVLDLATVVSRFPANYRSLDNFEGMCLGPRLGDDRTVLIVSDNNYNEEQKTSLLAFRLIER